MWYDIGTERLMCVTNVCVISLIDKIYEICYNEMRLTERRQL